MGYPTKYATIEDKHAFVDVVSFGNTCTDLLEKLHQMSTDGHLFRGQQDALWPIVSTGQRAYAEYIKNASSPSIGYLDFLCKALEYAKLESSFVPKKDASIRRNYYDHEIWGWLQHYSYPTPFIDFSRDWKVALYMATAHIDNVTQDGFFSIYAIPAKYEIGDNENVRLEKIIRNNKSILARCKLSTEQMFNFNTWKDFSFCLVHKDGSLKPWSKEITKGRIASQGGLFAYLNNAQISFEEYCDQQGKTSKGEDGEGCILPRIKCLDVPNSMAPLVRAFCKQENYTTERLGLVDQSKDDCMKCIKERFIATI